MSDDYDLYGGEDRFSEMDELLCEYVDGTMDAAVRRVFEECMSRDPELADHVENLKRTRALLCRYRRRMHAPFGFHRRLHSELLDEMMRAQAPVFGPASYRLRQAASFTSFMVALMMVGMLSGTYLFSDETSGVRSESAGQEIEDVLDGVLSRSLDRPSESHPILSRSSFGGLPLIRPSPVQSAIIEVPAGDSARMPPVEFDVDLLPTGVLP